MISKKNSALIFDPNFLSYKKIHKQTRILLFHLKNMKYSAALPMFLIWRENLLFFGRSGGQRDVIFHEKNIHKILLDLHVQKIICLIFNN